MPGTWRSLNRIALLAFVLAFSIAVTLAAQKKRDRANKPARSERNARPSQDQLLENRTFDPNIRSVQFYKGENELTFPVLKLGVDAQLTLEFDELTTTPGNYSVTIVHCESDWSKSALVPLDYFEGFLNDPINDVRPAQNTMTPYVHYTYKAPRPGYRFKHSGNYVLQVYRNGNESDVVLQRRFIVYEERVRIAPDVGLTTSVEERFRLQAVNFNIFPGGLDLNNPFGQLRVYCLQNLRWDNANLFTRPTYMYPDRMEFRFDAANDFSGGNEFRWFDARTIRQTTGMMRTIDFSDSIPTIVLRADKIRTTNAYTTEPDLNGAFYTGMRESPGNDQTADYVNVFFTLEAAEPYPDGDVYIFGAVSDWQPQERFRMTWEHGAYRAKVLLKQGLYNYQYVVWQKDWRKPPDEARIEGRHFETENAYTLLVYFREPNDLASRLIGLKHIGYYER